MRVLGISGSPRKGQTTDRLVHEVLAAVGGDVEFLSLARKKIAPCSACLACVKDNVCKIKDDMTTIRQMVLDADALVIGSPNYFSSLNGLTHCFLERLCQFRHQSGDALSGKLAAIVSVGGLQPEIPGQMIEKMLPYYGIEHVGTVTAQGAASCFVCGQGESCTVGAVQMMFGPKAKISDELIPDLDKQPESKKKARALGNKITDLLMKKGK